MIRPKMIMSGALSKTTLTAEFIPFVISAGIKISRGRTGAIFRPAFKASRSPPVSIRSLLEALEKYIRS